MGGERRVGLLGRNDGGECGMRWKGVERGQSFTASLIDAKYDGRSEWA
jgi:hypothetical protein